jgi:membrane protein
MVKRSEIQARILERKPFRFLRLLSRKIVLPGFDGVPLYDVMVFFTKGLFKGFITNRAASISFNFFLAVFPTLVFFFTIIPYIPIKDFQESLMALIADFLPHSADATVEGIIRDIVTQPHAGWFSISFVLTFYFSTNGVYSLMEAFNRTSHTMETRSWIKLRIVSLLLILIISAMLIISIGLITFGTSILNLVLPHRILNSTFYLFLLISVKWLVILALLFFAISFLYYLAPAKRHHFRFISAGSTLATLLVIITTFGFNFYVDNFSRYNVLYGSIGTLMVVLLWIYFNAMSLLIGFELNASIYNAKLNRQGVIEPVFSAAEE